MVSSFNPTFPDCVAITMHLAGGTAMYYDCGVAGIGGEYAAQWVPTQGTEPVSNEKQATVDMASDANRMSRKQRPLSLEVDRQVRR